MALPIYLAMTAWEFQRCRDYPAHCGWMACHFSAYANGLSNMPDTLPEGALLMLNDRMPPHGHDPQVICRQLLHGIARLRPRGIIFDFELPFQQELGALLEALAGQLPCPFAVTAPYCEITKGAVFLPPVPCHVPVSKYLAPWQGREIWLEAENIGTTLTLTGKGCQVSDGGAPAGKQQFHEPSLHCHYTVTADREQAVFALKRTESDTDCLLEEAQSLGVTLAVGLYQQWRN